MIKVFSVLFRFVKKYFFLFYTTIYGFSLITALLFFLLFISSERMRMCIYIYKKIYKFLP